MNFNFNAHGRMKYNLNEDNSFKDDSWFNEHHPYLESENNEENTTHNKKEKKRKLNQQSSNNITNPKSNKILKSSNININKKDDEAELRKLLATHNKKFTKVLYEPRQHTVSQVRKWESESGKRYSSLTPHERQEVNAQITELIKASK